MSVVAVDPQTARAGRVRRLLGQALKAAFYDHGESLAGYALVTWDMRGACHTGYLATHGVVSESLMPALVHDALNRHVAVNISQRTQSEELTDPSA
jgi:hypothetical protein